MTRYAIHLAASDAWDQVLYVEAHLVGEGTALVPDPDHPVAEVTWSAREGRDTGTLYVDDEATTNIVEWRTAMARRSTTTLLARAPNGQWRPLSIGSRIVLEEPGFVYGGATYVVQAINALA